jgi:protein-disulfide isomerase
MRLVWALLIILLVASFPALSRAQDEASAAAIAAHRHELFNDPASPSFGNADGDITIVEFFDYQCGYCKSAEEGVTRIMQEDSHIKLIYKDFAKLGPMSVTAANAAIASSRQGADKYIRFHYILMNKDVHVSDEVLSQAGKYVGLDIDQWQRDIADPAVVQQVQDNIALGRSVGVTVVPSFVIGKHIYPGFQTYDQLKQIIAYERSAL